MGKRGQSAAMGSRIIGLLTLLLVTLSGSSPYRLGAKPVAVTNVSAADGAYKRPILGRVTVYRPAGTPRAVIILLSDQAGWSAQEQSLARRLQADGALVTGVSTTDFLRGLSGQKGCINPNYAIIDLARDIQHRLKLPIYMKPILLGRGQGGTLAYATLAAGPSGAYRAALSAGFASFLPGHGQWCKSGTLHMIARRRQPMGWTLAPSSSLPSPWIIVSRPGDASPSSAYLKDANGGRPVDTVVGSDGDRRISQLLAPFFNAPTPLASLSVPSDMPLSIVTDPAAPRTDSMAILYSGDGGWVGLDRDVAAELARRGIPVVGVDSLSYFWSARTPAGAAADLAPVIRAYSRQWQRPHVMLIGYSFGADVLPHIVAHLPPDVRAQVKGMAMLGLSPSADFQFHLSSWLDMGNSYAYPTVPAITRLRGLPMLCIRGQVEPDSACPSIPQGVASIVTVPGGHHFDRNAALLAQQIVGRLPQ